MARIGHLVVQLAGSAGVPSGTRRKVVAAATLLIASMVLGTCGIVSVSKVLKPVPENGWREVKNGWPKNPPDGAVYSEAMFEDKFLSVRIFAAIPLNGVGLVGPVIPIFPVSVGDGHQAKFYVFVERKSNDVEIDLSRLEIGRLESAHGRRENDSYSFVVLPQSSNSSVYPDIRFNFSLIVEIQPGSGNFDGCVLRFANAVRTAGQSIPDLRFEMHLTSDAGIFSAS